VLVTNGNLPTLGASQTAPAVLGFTTAVKLEYWHKDQLGSLIATTDHLGGVTERYAYDPFGKRRYTNSTYDAFGALVIDWTTSTNKGSDRGFTGHEHLDDLGLIHMNGRIYDPTIGRFMQADPRISRPFNLQDFDRYSYCFNNPVTCTDPSGEEDESGGDAVDGDGTTTEGASISSDDGGCGCSVSVSISGGIAMPDGSYGLIEGSTISISVTASRNTDAPAGTFGFAGGSSSGGLEALRSGLDPTQTPMVRAAGVGLASLAATIWGTITNNPALVQAAIDGARDLNLSSVDGLGMAVGLGLGGRTSPGRGRGTGGRASGTPGEGTGGGGAGTPPGRMNRGLPEGAVPPNTIVCRGGECTAQHFAPGRSGVTPGPGGTVNGVSTQSRPGATRADLPELAQPFLNNQVGVTTVDAVRGAGGRATFDGTRPNPNHTTIDGLTPQQLESLFNPTVPNPVPKGDRGLK
jgi:RHS repeat-associated protein